MGVLEAHAPSDVLRSRQKALQALVDVSGALLTTATRAAEAERSARQTEELLSVAGEGAERKSRGLDLALGTAAHELRGPLAVSRSLLDNLLERDFASAEAWFDLLHRSRNELTHLLSICDTFLRWGMAVDPPEATPTDVRKVLNEIVEEAGHGDDNRVTIRMSCPSNLWALADEHLLRVAVSNLVRNALEHSPEGGLVDLSAQRSGDRIAIGVTDQGPGVAPSDREIIFEPFVKSTASRAGRTSGAGLGLFIARRLIEAQRGSIELLVTEGGTTFRVLIPDTSQEAAAGGSLQSAGAVR
jgi:signal transduction histidine kinase